MDELVSDEAASLVEWMAIVERVERAGCVLNDVVAWNPETTLPDNSVSEEESR